MSEHGVERDPGTDDEGQTEETGGGRLSGPGAGLGATGRTADDFDPGTAPPGADYSGPGGDPTADEELADGDRPD